MWNICRTCMSKDVEMISIFDQSKSPSISAMMMAISALEFLPNDILPSEICATCFETLEMAYQFKIQAIKCNNALQEHTQRYQMFSLQQVKEQDDKERKAQENFYYDQKKILPIVDSVDESFAEDVAFSVDVHQSICPDPLISTDNSTYDLSLENDVKPLNCELPLRSEAHDDILPEERTSDDNKDVNSHFEDTFTKTKEIEVQEHGVQFEDNYEITPKQIISKNKADDNGFFTQVVQKSSNENVQVTRQSSKRDKTYQCEICAQVFPWPSFFERHMRTHTGERPFKCQHCSATFTQSNHLYRHVRLHMGDATHHKCAICAKTFASFSNLEIHMRGHTGERPFKCQHCHWSFTSRGVLKNHLRTHLDKALPKPFKCEVCKKAFEAPHSLKMHMRSHSDERPFKCQHCNASFKHNKHLKRHIRKHTGEEQNN